MGKMSWFHNKWLVFRVFCFFVFFGMRNESKLNPSPQVQVQVRELVWPYSTISFMCCLFSCVCEKDIQKESGNGSFWYETAQKNEKLFLMIDSIRFERLIQQRFAEQKQTYRYCTGYCNTMLYSVCWGVHLHCNVLSFYFIYFWLGKIVQYIRRLKNWRLTLSFSLKILQYIETTPETKLQHNLKKK